MRLPSGGRLATVALACLLPGCGIDESLFQNAPDAAGNDATGDVVVAEASVHDGPSSDAGTDSGSGNDSAADSGTGESSPPADSGNYPDVGPVCDGGGTLGAACTGGTICCSPLYCSGAITCVWSCHSTGACTANTDCCLGTFCSDAGQCTCQANGQSCQRDQDCCSLLSGGGCDYHGDAGRTCGN
jgi:hypothetical protein